MENIIKLRKAVPYERDTLWKRFKANDILICDKNLSSNDSEYVWIIGMITENMCEKELQRIIESEFTQAAEAVRI